MFYVNNVRTVSDTKRDFYNTHTRPINSIYRRVVEELMVEMHLLSVNVDFSYDPIYALGVVTSFERFMQAYRPERDKDSIFEALCQAVQADPTKYQHDAQQLQALGNRLSAQELIAWFTPDSPPREAAELQDAVKAIANNPKFKYSRLFAIGLYSLLELADPDLVKDEKQRTDALKQICNILHVADDKLQKDLDLYRGNLEKMAQVQVVLEDVLKADRKKREQRAEDKGMVATPPPSSGTPKDDVPSGS